MSLQTSRKGLRVSLDGIAGSDFSPKYSVAGKLYAASIGTKFPNKAGTSAGAGFTKAGTTCALLGPVCGVKAGDSMVVAFPNHWSVEGSTTVNEQLIPADITLEGVGVRYTDSQGVSRVAADSAMSFGGVLKIDGPNSGGGVLVTFPIAYDMPPEAPLLFTIGWSGPDNFILPIGYESITAQGETLRKHATSSFAAIARAGGAVTGLSGAVAYSAGGLPGPAIIFAKLDGRPSLCKDGNSLDHGKGTPDDVAVPLRAAGVTDVACARKDNGSYALPGMKLSIAGSSPYTTDTTNPQYNPAIQQYRRMLVDQVVAMNGGVVPFTHYTEEHFNNGAQLTLAAHKSMMKDRLKWLTDWHPAPVIVLSAPPKSTSNDGYRSYEGQTPTNDIRWLWNDDLFATKLDGQAAYVIDISSPLCYDLTPQGRRRIALRSFTALATRDIAASAVNIYLSAAPIIGAALCLDPLSNTTAQVRVATAVVEVTPGVEYQVTTTGGASSPTNYPARPTGTLVSEGLSADGSPSGTGGLHWARIANEMIAAYDGPNSWQSVKQALKTAVGGNW